MFFRSLEGVKNGGFGCYMSLSSESTLNIPLPLATLSGSRLVSCAFMAQVLMCM